MNLIKMRVQIDTFCRLVSYQWKLITIQKFKKHTQKEDTTLICQSCTCLQNLNPNKMTLPFQAEKRSVQTGIACLEGGGWGGGCKRLQRWFVALFCLRPNGQFLVLGGV